MGGVGRSDASGVGAESERGDGAAQDARGVSRRRFLGVAAGVGLGGVSLSRDARNPGTDPDTGSSDGAVWRDGEPVVISSLDAAAPDRDRASVAEALGSAREAGVDVVFVPVAKLEGLEGAARNLLRLFRHLESLSDVAVLARRLSDLEFARDGGRLAVVPQLEGLQMVVEDLDVLREFSSAGVGVAALTHNWKNWNGDGCLERTDLSMTGLGELVVEAMNDAGVLLDLSRAGRRTSLHAMEVSEQPVIFSNSNAAGVLDHPRNLTDEQIDACGAGGGVVAVTAFPTFVSEGPPDVADLLDHVDYIADRIGPEHVGIGLGLTDRVVKRFDADPLPDSSPPFPDPLRTPGGLELLIDRLAARGYSDEEIRGVQGRNLLRVMRAAWS